MSSVLGAIEIQMLADLARLKKDMDEAKNIVGTSVRGIQDLAGGAMKALGAIGVGLSVGALVSWVKGAIDAADATSKLSMQTGIAAEDIAGLQLAFKLGGAGSDAMGSSLAKLSKQIADGNSAFDSLGVKTRNADGSLRSTKDVLGDVADQFKVMPNGVAKTASAMEMFGKSGAVLIPMLNGGREGLEAMDEAARKLGLSIGGETAQSAEQLNDTMDLLGHVGNGFATTVAGKMLPALNSLAGSLFESATQSGYLQRVMDLLGDGMAFVAKIVGTGGMFMIETISTVIKSVGGLAAAVVQLISGDFKGAMSVGREAVADLGSDWGKFGTNVVNMWRGTANETAQSSAAMTKALRATTGQTKEQEAATKGAAAEAKKHAAELDKLTKAGTDYLRDLKAKNDITEEEIRLGRELTEGEKQMRALQKDLAEGKKLMTAETLRATEAQILRGQAQREGQRLDAEHLKTLQAVAEHTRKAADEEASSTDAMRKSNAALIEQNEKLRIGEQAWEARERAVMLSQARDLEWQAANLGGNFQLEEQARLLRQRAQELEKGTMLKEAKAVADEWSKTTDSIYNGLTDSIFRGLEAGRDFFSVFWAGVKNTVKTTILQPTIKWLVNGAVGGVGGALGLPAMGATGGGGGGGGGLGSLLGNLGSLGGMVSAFGSGAGYGLAGLMAGNIGGTMGGIGAMFGSGSIGMGLGAVAGMAGPVVLGLMALKALSTKSTPHLGGYAAINSDGSLNDAFGLGESNRSSNLDASVIGLMRSITTTLNSTAGAFGQDANFAGTGVFKSDGKDGSWGVLQLLRGITQEGGFRADGTLAADSEAGFTEFSQRAALSMRDALTGLDLPQWASNVLQELGSSPGLDDLVKTAASINETARALDDMGSQVEPLGGVFAAIAGLSSDARFQLAEFAGGIGRFLELTRTYVAEYFTEDEKVALSARKILDELKAAGIDASGATAKADLRAAIEGVKPNTEEGRRQLAALLSVAQEYATVGKYLESNARTLGEVASGAPVVTALEGLRDPTEATALATQQTADSVGTMAEQVSQQTETLSRINEETRATVAATAEGMQALLAEFKVLNAAVARILGNGDQQLNAGRAGGG